MQRVFRFFSFMCLAFIKVFASVFYRGRPVWLSAEKEEAMQQVKLLVFLNHTSLFEPLFIRFAPWSWLWTLSHKLVVPGADITLQRPMTGRILKALMPGCVPITRKNDHSWLYFLSQVNDQKVTAILPEGRMKRRNGLDKFGKPMSVRGGVADILECLDEGKILFVYSGGLHHIQAPGDKWPNLFKTLKANMELVNIRDYKQQLLNSADNFIERQKAFKVRVIEDMNRRLTECVPGN
ncbi:1-acyl-sn-glycerol-3-phosphate acyltransferase [Planctobacterium marinum]|uniref:1-acyl-sn-glycerol-3-phosphate acyltransferase n=1 Tax=Planctobacterium marinum TaxID=1631968 RepID=UPI001E574628|nr:1-acyl-sn-glycerol-3-phosphate acyltransferase [Planctobacterium marinum]MCC2607260.1 1-acyl-sn-glycerol-3-phosphate acyltransferase [Planctobacterium marinum]